MSHVQGFRYIAKIEVREILPRFARNNRAMEGGSVRLTMSNKGEPLAKSGSPTRADPESPRITASLRASSEDLRLVKRILAGDENAFGALVDRYHGALLRLATVFVGNRATAEEVVQETWLGVLSGLRAFEGRSALKTWIFRILTNRAKTRGKREARSLPFSALASVEEEFEPAVEPGRFTPDGMWAEPPQSWNKNTPEQLLLREETRGLIERAIAELPPAQRAVVTLRDIDGMDSGEVCNILEIAETNQRVLLHRGRSKLRRALEHHVRRKQRPC